MSPAGWNALVYASLEVVQICASGWVGWAESDDYV